MTGVTGTMGAVSGDDDGGALSHLDSAGRAHMVDVGGKEVTAREARASARVLIGADVSGVLDEGRVPKGDVFAAARIAGIQAAKRTSDLIPLCHALPLSHASVDFERQEGAITVRSTVRCTGRTGVEMEALTAASISALTLYDMLKALDKGIVITDLRLESKSGGKSGDYERER